MFNMTDLLRFPVYVLCSFIVRTIVMLLSSVSHPSHSLCPPSSLSTLMSFECAVKSRLCMWRGNALFETPVFMFFKVRSHSGVEQAGLELRFVMLPISRVVQTIYGTSSLLK